MLRGAKSSKIEVVAPEEEDVNHADTVILAEAKDKFIRPYHGSGSKSPFSCHRGSGSIIDQIDCDLWWAKCH